MPLPKVPNGLKLSLVLPAETVLRVKTEAVRERTQPAWIVQRALTGYWGEPEGDGRQGPLPALRVPAPIGIRLTTRQKNAIRGRKLFALLQEALGRHLFTEEGFLKALGVLPSTYLRYWKPAGKVPVKDLRSVHAFLDNFSALEEELKEALRVPEWV